VGNATILAKVVLRHKIVAQAVIKAAS